MNVLNIRYVFHAHGIHLNTFNSFIALDNCPCGVWCLGTPQNICPCVYYLNTSQYQFYENPCEKFLPDLRIVLPVPGVTLILWTLWTVDLTSFLFLPWLLRSLSVWPAQSECVSHGGMH